MKPHHKARVVLRRGKRGYLNIKSKKQNRFRHQGNANQNDNEIPLHTHHYTMAIIKKTDNKHLSSEEIENLRQCWWDVKWCNLQFLKRLNMELSYL